MTAKKENILSINGDAILNEVNRLIDKTKQDKEYLKTNQAHLILEEILSSIELVDFRTYCNLGNEKTKLSNKHTVVACIELLLDLVNEKEYSLCRKNGFIYLYNSEYWIGIDSETFKDFLGKVALRMGVSKYEAKFHLYREELYKQFMSEASLNQIRNNNQVTLINLKNGTFEISPNHQCLRAFKKRDFLKYQLPFDFNDEAKAPLFFKFLNEVLPDKELQRVLAEYIGYIFIKNSVLKLEKVLLLFGSGANGKSVLHSIILALLGRANVSNYSLESLTKNPNSRAMISDKLLNYASEINGNLNSEVFKLLVSGEGVEAKLLYKNTHVITEYARLMFNCNELPKEKENTHAFFRRFLIIPFKYVIPEDKQDKNLANKIIESELSGVFNWVLQGVKRLLKNKNFSKSQIIEDEVLKYKRESDSILMFIQDENYIPSIELDVPLKTIYNEYKSYCSDNSYRSVSVKMFSKWLGMKGFVTKRKNYGNVVYIEKTI